MSRRYAATEEAKLDRPSTPLSHPKHTMKYTVTITVTDADMLALSAVITTTHQANQEWAKCGGGKDAEAEAKAITLVDRLYQRLDIAVDIAAGL